MNHVNRLLSVSFLTFASIALIQTQANQDSSPNNMLTGNSFSRQLSVVNYDANGNVTEMASVYGKIVFDGKGNFTLTGQQVDNAKSGGQPQPISVTGTYGIG